MKTDLENVAVKNNEEASRYEADVEGELALLEYERSGKEIIFTHTEVPPDFEGRGLGNKLVRTALEDARTQGLKVVPLCSFVKVYIRRHPEYQSLVQEK